MDPRAVVIGSIVDNLATFAMASLLAVMTSLGGGSRRLLEFNVDPDRFLLALEFGGLLCTIVGGYVAARIARRAHLWNGAGVGALAFAVGMLSQIGPAAELPGWYTASAFALVVPAGMIGGFLGQRRLSVGAAG